MLEKLEVRGMRFYGFFVAERLEDLDSAYGDSAAEEVASRTYHYSGAGIIEDTLNLKESARSFGIITPTSKNGKERLPEHLQNLVPCCRTLRWSEPTSADIILRTLYDNAQRSTGYNPIPTLGPHSLEQIR